MWKATSGSVVLWMGDRFMVSSDIILKYPSSVGTYFRVSPQTVPIFVITGLLINNQLNSISVVTAAPEVLKY